MTLSSTTVRSEYAGDGSTTAFNVGFAFWNSSELQVILKSSSGSETTWTEDTEYSVTGGSGSSGTVTASTTGTDYTPASGKTLIVLSNVANVQETSLPAGGIFPSTSVEQELDRMVRRIQQYDETFGRIPTLSAGSTFGGSSGITLPDPEDNGLLAWSSSDNTVLKNLTTNSSAYISVPASATDGNLVGFSGTTGEAFQDLGIASSDVLQNPMTAQGDLIYRGSSSDLALAIGTGNYVLTSSSSIPQWGLIGSSNFASGTNGQLLTWGSTGDPTTIAYGSTGQVLTIVSSSIPPQFQTNVAASNITNLANSTGSAAASISVDWTNDSYDEVWLYVQVRPDTDAQTITLRVRQSAADVSSVASYYDIEATSTGTFVTIAAATGNAATEFGFRGVVKFAQPADTTYNKPIHAIGVLENGSAVPAANATRGGDFRANQAAITGASVLAGSGNITGTIKAVGVKYS